MHIITIYYVVKEVVYANKIGEVVRHYFHSSLSNEGGRHMRPQLLRTSIRKGGDVITVKSNRGIPPPPPTAAANEVGGGIVCVLLSSTMDP